MKQLSAAEFAKRNTEVLKAMRIYTPHITNNITIAFDIYQQVLAEEKSDRLVSSSNAANLALYPCPECAAPMLLFGNVADEEGKHWPTAFKCQQCEAMYYSNLSVDECIKKFTKV